MRNFEIPHGMAQLILGVNILVFALCVSQSGAPNISSEVLFRYGAMYGDAIDQRELWRLIAHGFLHANPIHLFANMLCLALWGGLLEKRIGALYFTFVYGTGLVAGAIVSNITHPGAYLSVGASGAISAILGALLCLRILGRIDLPWSFFAINIGLNVALTVASPRIDWGAHFGGFVGGMVCCACLDLLEKVMSRLFRCKFPEFVKMNTFIAFAVVAAYARSQPIVDLSSWGVWAGPLAFAIAAVALVKLLDLTLSMRKGLAIVVLALALTNAGLVLLLRGMLAWALASLCAMQPGTTLAVTAGACANPDLTINLAAAGVFVVTMLAYWSQFSRGITDVGFVGGTLRAERGRHQGL
jgi:membrane associated rhomboid family serine protease